MCAAHPVGKTRSFPGHGDKTRVGHHAVFGANAEVGDVPMALQDLDRLDECELTLAIEGIHQLFDLQDGGQIAGEIAPRPQGFGTPVDDPPRFRQIEHDTIDIVDVDPFVDIADTYLEIGGLAHAPLDIGGGAAGEVLTNFLGDHPAFWTHGA